MQVFYDSHLPPIPRHPRCKEGANNNKSIEQQGMLPRATHMLPSARVVVDGAGVSGAGEGAAEGTAEGAAEGGGV